MCAYHWNSLGGLKAGRGGSRVHVVKQAVDLPERDASSSITDLREREKVRDPQRRKEREG